MPPFAIDQQRSETGPSGKIAEEYLTQLVDDLFRKMLGLTIDTADHAFGEIVDDALMAAIRISGQWNATLTIYASPKLAGKIACAMFGQEPGVLATDDVFDAFGEVVNVIGGNVKGTVDSGCSLSLPCVGPAESPSTPGGLKIAYDLNGDPLFIMLVED